MNMRYLRISGVLQRKGRGLIIVPAKHVLAEKLAKSTASAEVLIEQYKILCKGAPLPTDDITIARTILDDLIKQMKDRHMRFGKGEIYAYIVVFEKMIMEISYPKFFLDGTINVE